VKPYKIRREAVEELAEAAAWYDREAAPGVSAALIAEYEARLAKALDLPDAGTIVATTSAGTPVIRYRLKRFKRYAILMAMIDGHPTVLAFQCFSREPGYWHDRLR
jgi:hypothetical protein